MKKDILKKQIYETLFKENYRTLRMNYEEEEDFDDHKQIVCFKLDEQEFGIYIDKVIEVINTPMITNVINTPDFIMGVINQRGEIVPIIDLKIFFEVDDMGENKKENVIITEVEKKKIGFIVDEITEIKHCESITADGMPLTISTKLSSFMHGILNYHGDPIVVINILNIINSDELLTFS